MCEQENYMAKTAPSVNLVACSWTTAQSQKNSSSYAHKNL